MEGRAHPPKLKARISPVDRLGRSISPSVLDAAEAIALRAVEHAEQMLVDPAIAATLLEEAAVAVSRVLHTRTLSQADSVRDLPSYLFRAFIRRVNRTKRQQLVEEAGLLLRLMEVPRSINPKVDLELKILIDELLAGCNSKARDMFYRRTQGFSWKEIGASYGISGHAAESSFGQAIRRIAKRLGSRLSDKRSKTG
jgi:DNA-directed RNA polymerase specialized sigma24 family protein